MRFKSGIRAGLWWTPLVALLAVSPFFWRGTSNGHDLTFHVNSWIEVSRQWKAGILYPHWAAFANFGNGEPRFVFYPPISWTLGALLGLILPWQAVPGTLAAIVCVAAGISMYLFASEWLDDRTAVLAAILYAVNPYQLVVIYERGAFAEMIASIWLPGILLFALRERGGFARNVLLLAVHMAAVWLTNLPAAVISTYLLGAVLLTRALQLRRIEPILRGAAALALGLSVAAFFLIPAAYEQRWVQISQAVSAGALPAQNFLFVRTGDAERDAVLFRTSVFAVIEFAFAALFVWLAKPLRQRSAALYNILVGLIVLALLIMTPVSLPLWRYLPKLVFVQFPWRWLLVLNLALSFFAAVAFARTRVTRYAVAIVVPLVIGICYWKFNQPIYPEDRPVALAEAIADGTGYEGTDEYTPTQADTSNLDAGIPRVSIKFTTTSEAQRKLPPSELAHSTSQLWAPEHKRFTIHSQLPTRDTLRLLYYPAWQVRVDGQTIEPDVDESDGRIVLNLPAGHHEVQLDYRRTPDRTWGLLVSIVALLATLFLWFLARKPTPNAEPPSHEVLNQ
jgi:6-pyruvoyl-tetrahydropterin synthase related domain